MRRTLHPISPPPKQALAPGQIYNSNRYMLQSLLESWGFEVVDHIPIVPELLGRLFMFIDTLWHLPHDQGEVGDLLVSHFREWNNFPETLGELMQTLLKAEPDWEVACGAVFYVRKRG